MAQIIAVGSPANDSERKALAYLQRCLPDHYQIYHNLEMSGQGSFPHEFDAIILGDYAVYVIEFKGYQGQIRGNAREWQLESGDIKRSPVLLLNNKARIVTDRVRKPPLLDSVLVDSLVVLTSDHVHVRLDDEQAHRVVGLEDSCRRLVDRTYLPRSTASIVHLHGAIADVISRRFRPLSRSHEIGDYHVLDTIGKRPLYTTLLAEHRLLRTSRRFTLKVYTLNVLAGNEARAKHQELILRDANALHMLRGHENIVEAHPPFPWQDRYFVLPLTWIDGFSLRGLIDAGVDLPLSRKLDIVRQVCDGLQHAHDHGILHRNIHPDHIIVPPHGSVKLIDFDCARVSTLTSISNQIEPLLNPRYLAPEVRNQGSASRASDLYAVGIVLFELLTGKMPYLSLDRAFERGRLRILPRDVKPDLPSDVDEIVARLCAEDPSARYPDARSVATDLYIIA
jgi:hypothetical protein